MRAHELDPGLAPERTSLAWGRSALAVATVGGLLAKLGFEAGGAALGALVAILLVTAAVAVRLLGTRVYADRRDGRPPDLARQRGALRFVCGVSLLTALTAFALALLE